MIYSHLLHVVIFCAGNMNWYLIYRVYNLQPHTPYKPPNALTVTVSTCASYAELDPSPMHRPSATTISMPWDSFSCFGGAYDYSSASLRLLSLHLIPSPRLVFANCPCLHTLFSCLVLDFIPHTRASSSSLLVIADLAPLSRLRALVVHCWAKIIAPSTLGLTHKQWCLG